MPAIAVALFLCVCVAAAAPARADAAPSSRDIQAAVDRYLGGDPADTHLVGGPGSAGYDSGFWIKGGDFSLKVNLTLQARYEAWIWDSSQSAGLGAVAGGPPAAVGRRGLDHGSGFSLPRATLKFSGTAPCNISYYLELEFGHLGRDPIEGALNGAPVRNALGPLQQSLNFDSTREAWIQWSMSDMFNVRMGQIATANTRQLMIAPELQQFVDISLASAFLGSLMPGATDRNRDHGIALHGAFGCKNEWSYLLTITNGDGSDSIRNVIDTRTSDSLAFALRLNWAFLNPIGYQEGALNQKTCQWYGEAGGWVYYYADRFNRPQTQVADSIRYGLDLALGYGGWSFNAAVNNTATELAPNTNDFEALAWLVQLGYHFPGTAWELAARFSTYDTTNSPPLTLTVPAGGVAATQQPLGHGRVQEIAFGVNYYLNGHGNKLQVDAALVSGDSAGAALLFDPYTGYPGNNGAAGTGSDSYGILLRFQWQLAL